MGAWGVETFENDDACDYVAYITDGSSLEPIEAALDEVLATGTEYLDATEANLALAAADILARLQGRFGQRDAFTEDIDEWVARVKPVPSVALIEKARRSIQRILTEPSELLASWRASPKFDRWKSAVDELSSRLSNS